MIEVDLSAGIVDGPQLTSLCQTNAPPQDISACCTWFPAEIVHAIATHCAVADLPNLARVNRSYGAEAERVLYRDIRLTHCIPECSILGCFDTLATNLQKAEMVRLFTMFESHKYAPVHLGIWVGLCKALMKMRRLRVLDLKFPVSVSWPYEVLNKVLRRCEFSLVTFCASVTHALAVPIWTHSQIRTLKTFAITSRSLFPTHPQLVAFQALFNNTLVHLFWLPWYYTPKIVAVFPTLVSRDEEGVVQWSAEPLRAYIRGDSERRTDAFDVYIDSLEDEKNFAHILGSIARHFPWVRSLALFVRDPAIHVYPRNMSAILALFNNLTHLHIRFWPGTEISGSILLYQQERKHIARNWAAECSKLGSVSFPDDVISTVSV